MVEAANVRKPLNLNIDLHRGFRSWNRDQLADVENGRGGYVPNPGDTIMGVNENGLVTETVISVDYEKGTWMSQPMPGDEQVEKEMEMNVDMLGNMDSDAGAAARARLNARKVAIKTAHFIKALVLWAVFFAFLIIAAGAAWANYSMVTERASDYRECKVQVGDKVINGRREYSYKYNEVFGHRFINTGSTTEKTIIYVDGRAINVVGLYNAPERVEKSLTVGTTESYGMVDGSPEPNVVGDQQSKVSKDRWWGVSVQEGERGIQQLKPAHTYVFSSGQNVAVVDYNSFCR